MNRDRERVTVAALENFKNGSFKITGNDNYLVAIYLKPELIKEVPEDLINAYDLFVKYNSNLSKEQRAHLFLPFLRSFCKPVDISNTTDGFEDDVFGENLLIKDFLPGLPYIINKVSEKDFKDNPTNIPSKIELLNYEHLINRINLLKIEMAKINKQESEHFENSQPTTFPPKLIHIDREITFVLDGENLSNTREPEITPNPRKESFKPEPDTISESDQFEEYNPMNSSITGIHGSGIYQKSQKTHKKVGLLKGFIQLFKAENRVKKTEAVVVPDVLGKPLSSGYFFDKQPWINAGKLVVLNNLDDARVLKSGEVFTQSRRTNNKNNNLEPASPKNRGFK